MTFADECLERANKASKGPWIKKMHIKGFTVESMVKDLRICQIGSLDASLPHSDDAHNRQWCDAEFIAHARTDVVELANRLKRAIECLRILASRLESDDVFYNTRKALHICIEQLERPLENK